MRSWLAIGAAARYGTRMLLLLLGILVPLALVAAFDLSARRS